MNDFLNLEIKIVCVAKLKLSCSKFFDENDFFLA